MTALFLLMLMVPGCTSGTTKKSLSTAEKLIMDMPDSALAVISAIDTSSLHSRRYRAEYSLLHTMAIDRVGKDTTNLCLIKDAADYFKYHGNELAKSRAAFYEGRILYNREEFTTAQLCFLNAYTHSDTIDDDWLKGMICYYLATTYNKNHLNAEELRYGQLSLEYFQRYGDDKYVDYALNKLAIACHNNRQFDKADSLFSLISAQSNSYKYALLGKADNELSRDQPDAKYALSLLDEAAKEMAPFARFNLYQYAYALALDGQKDLSNALLLRLSQEDGTEDVKSLWWKYATKKAQGDYFQALDCFEKYAQQQDLYINSILAQSLYKAEGEYYSKLKDASEKHATIMTLLLVIVSLLFLLILSVSINLAQRRRKHIQSELYEMTRRFNDIQVLLNTLRSEKSIDKEHDAKQNALQLAYVSLFQEQFSEIGRLVGTNLNASSLSDYLQRRHLLYIDDLLNELSSDKGKNARFEERINRSLDGIVIKIRNDFPQLGEENIRFLCLVIAGFKDPTIAAIMKKSTTAVSTRRSRLKKIILSADTPNKPLYEAVLK